MYENSYRGGSHLTTCRPQAVAKRRRHRRPIWQSGSKFAPDLSFLKIRERLTDLDTPPTTAPEKRRRPNLWHQATAAAERIPTRLAQSDDATAQAHIAAFGEVLDALPVLAPKLLRPQLQQTATAFERATRSRIRAQHDQARALRSAIRALRTAPVAEGGSGLAMFLDVALLVVTATAHWHQLRQHDQQVTAAHQALIHLRAAYEQAATAPLATLALRKPPAQTVDRLVRRIWETAPSQAQQILGDRGWDALTTVLTEAERLGHNPDTLLQQAIHQRPLDDARHPAEVLTWRIRRLGERRAPSTRALAAQARSGMVRPAPSTQVSPTNAMREATASRRPRW
ncbi:MULTISPECIES: hypothetical protein [Streptomyces]|uniref:Mobilization protein n=1 Tax=Streptomyces demainii TaxID=588122 RepID=A0ABT9KK66_9ACTN|nr:hypothetical protein [Streptomyces demainii]